MKSINVKKLAALAVGALFVGQTVHAAMAADTLPTDKAWYLNSAIVIGAAAQPADVVWAGNIAAAIGNMAFTEETKTVDVVAGDLKVQLSVPGEIVVGGQGYTDDGAVDLTAGTWDFVKSYGATKVTVLKDNEPISFKYKLDTATEYSDADAKVKETLDVKLDVVESQVTNTDSAEIRAKTEAGGMGYTMYISGLYGDELTGTNVYVFKNFYIQPLGLKFEITKIDLSTNQLTLVASQSEETVPVGGTVEFGGYTIKVVDIDPDNNQAYLELLDSQGNVVASDVVAAGSFTDFGGVLADSIKLDTVFAGTETKFAKLILKASEMVLDRGSANAKELEGYEGWYIEWDIDANNNIVIKITYKGDTNDSYLTFDTGLKPGDTFSYIGSAGYGVSFLGFEAKPMKTVKFDGTTISFIDKDGASHTGVLFKEVPDASITDGTNSATFTIYNFLDGQKAKFEVTVTPTAGTDLGGTVTVNVDLGADGDYELTGTATDANLLDGSFSLAVDAIDGTLGYNLYMTFSTAGLDANADGTISDFTLARVFFADNKVTTRTEDTPYTVVGTDASGDGIPESWTVTEIGGATVTVNFDTTDKELDFENFTVDVSAPAKSLNSKADDSYPANWWTNSGTEVKVVDMDTVEISVPIASKNVKIFVGVPEQTVEAAGIIEAGVGETVMIGNTEVKIEGVKGAEPITYTTVTPMADWSPMIVYLDSELPNTYDKIIVVGGYYVNEFAQMLAENFSELYDVDTEGEWIVKKFDYEGKEYIVVFGYTADDTGTAAQEFISWLRENVA